MPFSNFLILTSLSPWIHVSSILPMDVLSFPIPKYCPDTLYCDLSKAKSRPKFPLFVQQLISLTLVLETAPSFLVLLFLMTFLNIYNF